ncbi:DNA adenine methylase [Haloferax sulfurifontis]|uniref:site-specific DNA-methyltransferase (cytosine-N(4)-specific) n=1 Tax=Haloferax sulfurifontis ATCC BAA-897 TaxID=662480 RepID=M0I5B0_9EURY|nr:DNA adenine methylase [Haloferax sulfurifontis]ELZ91147.1 adenine-specific DNA methylase [Haloferax sulfurifontis ATCC BAA-897]
MAGNTRQTTLGASDGEITSLEDIDWTFEKADTSYLTHGLHSYPARMIPQIPDALLNYYKSEGIIDDGDTVYDPFSGSGTTAVEGRLHGLHAEANDINPLAVTLSKAKAEPLDVSTLQSARDDLLEHLSDSLERARENYEDGSSLTPEDLEIRDGWFPEPQLSELYTVSVEINQLETKYSEEIGRFFRIVLSAITRKVSYQRNGEYKRYRMPEEKRESHNPDVYDLFVTKLDKNIKLMREYSEQVDHSLNTTIHYADSRTATTNDDDAVEENSADIVITSPPYGDHRTTVAYGQFSQDPAIIAGGHGYDEMKSVDKTGLGGSNSELEPLEELEEWSPSFAATMDTLREKEGRSEDAMDFVRDYYEVMKEVAKILKPGQPSAWVVANRTMSRVNIPTHLITKELCEHVGFEYQHMLPREIPNKTLPWSNAPENVPGVTGDLMANENIVVMTAPDN